MKKRLLISVTLFLLIGCPTEYPINDLFIDSNTNTESKEIQTQPPQEIDSQKDKQEQPPLPIQEPTIQEDKQEQEAKQEQEEQREQVIKSVFEGSWITNTINNAYAVLQFTGNTFVYDSHDVMGMCFKTGTLTGSFTFTENTITLTSYDIIITMVYNFRANGNIVFENYEGNKLFYSGFETLKKENYL
jgi:hypothetical protein